MSIYAVICAGGTGKRMGSQTPKQFMLIGDKPIIVHSVKKFIGFDEIQKIIVLTPQEWIEHTIDLLTKHIDNNIMQKIEVIAGASQRNETIMNAINHIAENYGLDSDTIIVTHDAVRPFLSHKIIEDNIEAVKKYRATNTVIPAVDTIVESEDGEFANSIPDRAKMFHAQTPQCFYAQELKETYQSLTEEEKELLTDATKIYVLKGKPVYMVMGDKKNIKITYPQDIKIGEIL